MNEQTAKAADDQTLERPAATTAGNRGKLSDYLAHVENGDKAVSNQDFATAITEFQAAALMRPNMFHPQMMLGKILYQQGMPGEAIDFLHRAHEMQPNNVIVMLHIAEMLTLIGEREGAQGVLCDALAVDDKNVNVICMLAQLLIAEEKLDQAISLLQAAIEEANEEAELWRCVGDAMSAKEDWANAKTFYEEALRLDASLQPAIDGLAKIGETKDTEAAVH